MTKKKIIQALLFLFPFFLSAQTYHFAHYGVKDGLAQSNVSGIVQDRLGYYWFATDGGVSKFDGKNFINYTIEDGLADNNVSAIFLDKDQHIWLGHENGALTFYDGSVFKAIQSKLLPKDNRIISFYQDRSGSLWISTFSAGVIKIIDPSHGVSGKVLIKVYSSKEGLSQNVFSTIEDRSGNFWFLTDIGVKRFDKKTGKYEFFHPQGLPVGQVVCLSQDHDRNLLMGTTNGVVFRYDTQTGAIVTLINAIDLIDRSKMEGLPIVLFIKEDSKGNVWASGSDYGLFQYNNDAKKSRLLNTSNGLSVNKIKTIFEDNEANLILGTRGEGFEVYSGERFISYSKNNGLINNQVYAICQDDKGNYFFGTTEGISVYAKGGAVPIQNLNTNNGLPNNNVRALVKDKSGNIWVATWGGKVVKYDAQQQRLVSVPALNDIVFDFVSSLMIDRNNNLWIGTMEGIVKYNLNSGFISTIRTIDGLAHNDISCLFEAENGDVWIGSKQKGLTVFNGKTFKKFNRENGLTYNSVSALAQDHKKNIWIATEGGGAFVYDTKTFTNYRVKNGLGSDFISLITIDDKNQIWLGSNKGISKFNPENQSFYTYSEGDGFTGVETKHSAVYQDEAKNIWFGSVNGAYRYDPKLDQPINLEPLTQLKSFKVNLNEYPINSKIKLSYKENNLIFGFIGISLSNPEGVKYKIKLDGYDEDWKPYTKQNVEVYSNLPPNNYVFSLIACNSSGICNQMPVSINIIITPPYWKTWWFYLLVALSIVGILFTYIKIRERALRLEKKVLEDKVSERTAEVVEKNKELDMINKDITASIRYAKRIQDAILPPDEFVKKHLPNTFVLFKPKDIVSGDFYWMADKGESVIFAAVDCTGHGVPGAFMSIVGHNLLERIVGEHNIIEPAKILDELNKSIGETLRQSDLEDNTVRDGMDIALCTFNKKTALLQFAGAFNPLWLVRSNELTEIKANKFPIGNTRSGENNKFTNNEIQLQKGDAVYIFSDGYSDQFGGPKGKKFKASNLKQLLVNSQHLSMEEQYHLLNTSIESWRGNHEQVDDILVIGSRYI